MLNRFSGKFKIMNGVLRGSVLFFCLAVLLFVAAGECFAFEGRVSRVIDGDTFVLDDSSFVRIASIDTPEIGHKGEPDQYYALEAKRMLEKLLLDKRVRIESAAGVTDRYKRIVGWVYIDGLFVNEYMIRNGAAFFYYHADNDEQKQNLLLQAQRKAYKEKKGFWPVITKLDKFNTPWVGNKRSHRCFPEGDRFARRIKKRNRVYFSSLGEGYLHGYTPARPINIWPVVK